MENEIIDPVGAQARYVTYDAGGVLTGCYLQAPPAEHVDCMVVIDEALALDWYTYRANEARDGVELAPPAPAAQPARAVPASVTRRQARQALLLAGLLDHVPAALAKLDDGTPAGKQQMRMAQIEWEDAIDFERARPLVIGIGAALGLNSEQLDDLFVTAAGL